MTEKRFEINNEMTLTNKVETYELSCIVDNDNKTFYFIVDSIANVESFVERLNELVEENMRLRKEVQGFIKGIQDSSRISAEAIMKGRDQYDM